MHIAGIYIAQSAIKLIVIDLTTRGVRGVC